MIATERMDYILQKLEAETTVTIKEIAASLNVSEATIRRDFERLEQKGLALRVRAGAYGRKECDRQSRRKPNSGRSMYFPGWRNFRRPAYRFHSR